MRDVGRATADLTLTSGSAGNLLPHDRENSLGPAAVALDDAFKLRASVRRHAETFDYDVADLVRSILRGQPPIDFEGLGRPSANYQAGNDDPIRSRPAAGHPRVTAVFGIFRQFL